MKRTGEKQVFGGQYYSSSGEGVEFRVSQLLSTQKSRKELAAAPTPPRNLDPCDNR